MRSGQMLRAGDVVSGESPLCCAVADQAQRASHSFIKNGFLFHTDRVLGEWIRDERSMREFEECVRSVCRDIRSFSGSGLIPQLRPLQAVSEKDRARIADVLDRAFEEDFGPGRRARRLERVLEILLRRVHDVVSGNGELGGIREAAKGLRMELDNLPLGYWLPGPLR